jgi:hypothetical protein
MKNKHENREQWLAQAVALLTPLFETKGYKVPPVRVSCGWPSSRGMSATKPTIGECWDNKAADDRVNQIFISPRLKEPVESFGVLPTLAHEVAHAVVGIKNKHNKIFGACARAIGLEGKLTATTGSAEFLTHCNTLMAKLGPYPHAALNPSDRPTKKQTTRLIKVECPCGCSVRITRKWLDEVGAPTCGCGTQMTFSPLTEGEDE